MRKGKMLAANKTMIFKHMDHLKILLTEIGKIFLCNIQINDEIVHMGVENFMILGHNVDEKNIKHINFMATMFGLQNTAETPAHLGANLDLSDSEEDEKPVEPPPSFLATIVIHLIWMGWLTALMIMETLPLLKSGQKKMTT